MLYAEEKALDNQDALNNTEALFGDSLKVTMVTLNAALTVSTAVLGLESEDSTRG